MSLTSAGTLIRQLATFLTDGSTSLEHVPWMVVRVIDEESWRERLEPTTNEVVRFDSFVEFVTGHAPDGMNCSLERLEALCRGTPAEVALTRALQRPHGGDRSNVDNIHVGHPDRPTGTSRAAGFRALAKHAPAELEKVRAGKKSVHRAMVEAGLRKTKSPLEQIRHLYRKLSQDDKRAFLDEVISKSP